MLHRAEEDALYRQFARKRAEEEHQISTQIREEWEEELAKLTSRLQTGGNNHLSQERAHLEKNMTIKLDRRKETATRRLLEQERQATAELVDKQSQEMIRLIGEKLLEYQRQANAGFISNNGGGAVATNGHTLSGSNSALNSNHMNSTTTSNHNFATTTTTTTAGTTNTTLISTSLSTAIEIKVNSNGKSNSGPGSPSNQSNYPVQAPSPTPPALRKSDLYTDPEVFEHIDQVAINVANQDQRTFTDLVRMLIAPCETDMEKARAIFRWVTVRNLNTMQFDEHVNADTPMGILRGIKHGTESYHVLFKRLCR